MPLIEHIDLLAADGVIGFGYECGRRVVWRKRRFTVKNGGVIPGGNSSEFHKGAWETRQKSAGSLRRTVKWGRKGGLRVGG